MAATDLVVQTSEGADNANVYALITTADTYLALRGRTTWGSATEANKCIALIRATDYMDSRWGAHLTSTKLDEDQYLEWPRTDLGLPQQVINACIEYAFYALSGDLYIEHGDAGRTASSSSGSAVGQTLVRELRRIGPITTEKSYGSGSVSTTRTNTAAGVVTESAGRYPRADALMRPYLVSHSQVIRN